MSVKRRNVTTSRHSIEEKLSAVRQRMYGELSFQDVLERYGVCGSTLSEWLRKYRDEVLRLEREKGIPPDFVNAYPKNHQRIEVRYVDAVS